MFSIIKLIELSRSVFIEFIIFFTLLAFTSYNAFDWSLPIRFVLTEMAEGILRSSVTVFVEVGF